MLQFSDFSSLRLKFNVLFSVLPSCLTIMSSDEGKEPHEDSGILSLTKSTGSTSKEEQNSAKAEGTVFTTMYASRLG